MFNSRRQFAVTLLTFALLAACSEDPSGSGSDPARAAGGTSGLAGHANNGGKGGKRPATTEGIAGTSNMPEIGGQAGTSNSGDSGGSRASTPTLDQYRTCERDGDCPSGLGDCIKQVYLDKADAKGRTSIAITELFPKLSASGICTLSCTTNPEICSSLTLRDASGSSVPFACQLVAAGVTAYVVPTSAASTAIASTALAVGDAYGAICRPPFGLDRAWPDEFCQACSTATCLDGLCWDVGNNQAPSASGSGVCLGSCSASKACPAGFVCDALGGGSYCRPVLGTCGDCSDVDKDGRGLGHCSTSGATPIDCDDKNPQAYYDPLKPDHSFPNSCGEFDYNCNGVWDSVEIVSRPADYGALHCGSCNSACTVPATGNVLTVACNGERCTSTSCKSGWLDCNLDLSDGCESTASASNTFKYYLDSDGDGYGTGEPLLLCQSLPKYAVGTRIYVPANGDCNDTNPSIHPDVPDYCDGVDNDCDGVTGEDGVPPDVQTSQLKAQICAGLFGSCYANATFSCLAGMLTCTGAVPNAYEICGNGLDDDCDGGIDGLGSSLPAETCNGRDDDCDGKIDAADIWNAPNGATMTEGTANWGSCIATGAVGGCRNGTWTCGSGTPTCTPGAASSNFSVLNATQDVDCDGVVDSSKMVFFATSKPDSCPAGGSGTSSCPFVDATDPASLNRINAELIKAKTSGKSIIVAAGSYTTTSTINLVDGVHISGGWEYDKVKAEWTRPTTESRTKIRRTAAADPTYAGSNLIIAGRNVTAATSLDQLELSMDDIPDASTQYGRNAIGIWCYACNGLTLQNVEVSAGRASSDDHSPGEPSPTTGLCIPGIDEDSLEHCSKSYNYAARSGHAGLPGMRAAMFDYASPRAVVTTGVWGAKYGPNGWSGGNGEAAYHYPAIDYASCVSSRDSNSHQGCGGVGGIGGRAGGSSIAIQILQSPTITLKGVTIKKVGNGGNGGVGQHGGAGSNGLAATANDRAGGPGGGGAGGGGGNGGHCIGIVVDQLTANQVKSSGIFFDPNFTRGIPGIGGDGGFGGLAGAFAGSTNRGAHGARGPSGRSGLSLKGYCLDCAAKLQYKDTAVQVEPDYDVECRQMPNSTTTFVAIDPDGAGELKPIDVFCRNGAALVVLNSYAGVSLSTTWEQITTGGSVHAARPGFSLNAELAGLKLFLGADHWMNLGNTLRVDMGDSVAALAHRAGSPFTLQATDVDSSDDSGAYRLWLTTERVKRGDTSFGLYDAGSHYLTYGDTSHSSPCSKQNTGPFWFGVDRDWDGKDESGCLLGGIWGLDKTNTQPIWNTNQSANFGAFWVKDVVYPENCDGLAAGSYLVDADYVGATENGDDNPPTFVDCSNTTEVTWSGRTYRFVEVAHSWQDARTLCNAQGGDLITVDDAAENLWLDGQIDSRGGGEWWLGLNNLLSKDWNTWGWADGTIYTKWNMRTDFTTTDDCAAYIWSGNQWAARPCTQGLPFICELH